MSDLVTPAAIDAALNAWHGGLEHYRGEVKQRLALIADLIAAEALRQAASEQRKQYAAGLIDDLTAMWLEARADELEGK